MKSKKKGLIIFTVLLFVLFVAPVFFNYISEVNKQIELANK